MAADRERLTQLQSSRLSPNTLLAYASDWKDFQAWCERTGKRPLPASPETVALYLSHLLPKYRVSTLDRRLAAILNQHGDAGHPGPDTPMVKQVLRSARRSTRHRPERKAAISIEELLSVSNLLASEEKVKSVRDRAVLLLGFGGAFRRSELAGLDLGDIDLGPDRVTVTLARAKNDQEAHGRVLVIPKAKRAGLCPVRALNNWIVERGRWPGPLFLKTNTRGTALKRERMQGWAVWWAVKTAAKRAGLDAQKFGAHSLRAGFVTASVEAGADVFDIMAVTGHKNVETLGMYVRKMQKYPLRAAL